MTFKKYDNVLKDMCHLSDFVVCIAYGKSFLKRAHAVLLLECSCLLKVAIKGIRTQIKDY